MKKKFDFLKFAQNLSKNCPLSGTKKFKKNEIITTYLLKRNQICILLSGMAYLVRYTDNGERRIIYTFKSGDAFGEVFYKLHTSRELFVEAKKDCEVLFLPYDKMDNCGYECTYHVQLLKDLPDLFIARMAELNTRTELLTHKSIRDRLLFYFHNLAVEEKKSTFIIPFSYTDLADYLVLDRSAMMRELTKMDNEGIIKKNGKTITIKKL